MTHPKWCIVQPNEKTKENIKDDLSPNGNIAKTSKVKTEKVKEKDIIK